jgi:glucokinase
MKSMGWNHVKVVNDLEAMAYGIPLLRRSDVYPLNRQKVREEKNFGLIAPGTGLGMVMATWNDGRYIAVSSEGGHADFSPANHEEFMLSEHIKRHYGHTSMERIISGPGIENIYVWLRDSERYKEPKWLAKRMMNMDGAKVITQAAMENRTPICVKTLNLFVSAFGRAAGNLALTGLTLGGMYLGGGIPHKILPWLDSGLFMESFVDKGRFTDMLKGIAVKVLLNEKIPLQGAASIASDLIR